MEDEGRVLLHFDELGEVFLLLANVDVRVAVVVKNPEIAVNAHVHAGGLEQRVVVRLDLDPALLQEARNRPVRENHEAILRPTREVLVFHTLPQARPPRPPRTPRNVLQPVDPNARYKVRRAEARQRRHKRRFRLAGALLALIAAGVIGGIIATHVHRHNPVRASSRSVPKPQQAKGLQPRPLPKEVRGVHVTMALAGLPGKLDQYIALKKDGLNAIELDVKDENGEVGWPVNVPLARRVGSGMRYYNPARRSEERRV